MPRHREFGISELLLTLVIVPLVSVVILNKWKKNRAARKAEIKKLLLLAADEAARVEAEAAAEYTYATAVNRYQCAVCFSPTTTRCSRCKAVRYCSGKCQIIHWRQGHKQDCQPPDINGSTASVSCISTTRSALDSTLYESQELRSSESNLQGTRTSASTNKKAYHYISEKPEFSTSEAPQASTSPEATVEISGPEGVNVIEPVLDTIQTSSVDHKALDSTIQKESRISDVPIFDNSVSDVPCSYNGYSLNNLSSDALTSRDANSDVRKFETPESDVHSSNSVNNIFSSKVCTPNLPIPKNHTICHPVSSISLDNHPGSSSSENGHHNSTSLTSQMPDLPSKGKIPPISKDPVHDLLTSKSSLRHSSSPSRRVVDASGRLHPSFVTNTHVVDAPISRSSGKDILRSEVSVTNSVGQSSSVSNVSSLSSLPTTDDPSTFTCTNTHAVDAPVSRSSGKISKVSATNSVSQSSSVSNVSSSNSSLPTSTCSKFEGPASSEVSNKTPAPQIDSPMTSVSNGTSRRSVRTVFQHSSPHRERASVRTISRQKTGSSETVSSNAFQTVVSSLNASNSLKASVKKVAQQLKSSKSSKQNAAKSINEGVGKSSKVLFSYDYFVKLFNWDKLDVPPCGLINCGNSCYANAVLQCLTFTRPIAAYLLQGSHSKNCQRKDWCFMCELEHLVSRVREGKSPISPISILSQIQNIGNHLGYGREEDAHEFLRFAIDTMQSVCLDESGGEKAVNSRIQETTLIQQTFGGYLQSKIKCLKCQHVSERYENMMDLTVEIQGNIESLQDALTQFTASEILDGENKYKCDRCKSYVKAIKQLTVHEAPNILTIALKRFQTGKFGKLNKRVMFPEVLNMKPYMSGTGDKPPLYKLYAVVVHLDMMNASFSGHYVCYVKNLQGTWYKTDDCKVKQVELDRVLSQGAYMLLYSRSSPRSPPITKNGTVNSSTTLNVVPCTKAAKQPLLNHGQERIGVLDPQFSPLASCTVNFEDFGFNYDRAPSFIGNRRMDSTPLSYADLTSSDSGSLFSCSDEASCSTESNRDSTSTDDYVETVFGDSGRLTSNGCGLLEDSYPMSNSFLCMKSSPCPPQTEYYFENDSYFRESEFSNLQLSDNIHHGRRKSDQGFSSLPNPPPLDTDGLPAWFSNSASSYFFPPSIQSSHVESCCFDSDPSSRHSDWLDNRTTNTNEYSDSLKSQNSVWAPDVSETGAYNISEDFAAPAKSQYVKEKYMSHIIKESERSNFDASSRPHNIVTNFDYCLVHDMRTSDTPTFQSFGLKR